MDPKQKRKRPRKLGSEEEAAALLGVSVQTLRNARCTGRGTLAGVEWFRFGSGRGATIRYDLHWVEDEFIPRHLCSHGELDAA